MEHCPICTHETQEGQRYCINCGRDLSVPVSWHCPQCLGNVTAYDRDNMKHCPHCGEEVDGDRLITDEELEKARKLKALR